MQITEKVRNEIALSLPNLGAEDCKAIATTCNCSNDTVYRMWRVIRGKAKGRLLMENPVVLELAELALKRRDETKAVEKRVSKIMQQLSVL